MKNQKALVYTFLLGLAATSAAFGATAPAAKSEASPVSISAPADHGTHHRARHHARRHHRRHHRHHHTAKP
jgi:hypothetical protein